MVRLNVALDDELHLAMKLAVAKQRTTIGRYVSDAIAEKLQREEENEEGKEKQAE